MRGKSGAGVAALVSAVLIAAVPVFAQETADVTTSTTGWVFRWLNFAIVLALIVWGFAKAGPHFRKVSQDISQKIAEGARARETAENQKRAVQEKLSRVDQEIAQMRADAKRAAAGETERIRAQAKEDAQVIERAGQAEIGAAERAARIELKMLAGRLAVEKAEAILRDRMTPDTETAVFRAFVDKLQESRN